MIRWVLGFLLVGVVLVFSIQGVTQRIQKDLAQPVSLLPSHATPTPGYKKQTVGIKKESIFVPYWAVSEDAIDDSYTRYLYFGITSGKNGIAMDEVGMQKLDTFLETVPQQKEKFLTLRMVDNASNVAVLKSNALQKKIISQTVSIAKEKGFEGVLLDLELSAIPFDSLVQQISTFNQAFSIEVKKQQLQFAVTLYGDTVYRLRPFEVKTIASYADQVLIMAYDFHKARSNPGPNFPLQGKEVYGYSLDQMSTDFLQVVPQKKIAVIFGYFGYDWIVDAKGKALKQAQAYTYHEIEQKFLQGCAFSDCVLKRDTASSETKITYTDAEGQKHVVWFEDPQSIEEKQTYLQERGINSFSYWAYSYF